MRIAIMGAGGHAKVIADTILADGNRDVYGFFDDDQSLWKTEILGFPVLGPIRGWQDHSMDACVIGIGRNAMRKRLYDQLKAAGARFATVVHPRASIGRGAMFGDGVVAFSNVVVNVDTTIGTNCILNTACIVDHDCSIGPHSHLAPGVVLAGEVQVGQEVFIGTGAKIIPRVRIGDSAVIGAGTVIIRDVAAAMKVVGVPARTI